MALDSKEPYGADSNEVAGQRRDVKGIILLHLKE
jgi:hypothetical protein